MQRKVLHQLFHFIFQSNIFVRIICQQYFYIQAILIYKSNSIAKSIKIQLNQMINFTQLFSCQNTQIYEKIKNEKKYIDTGKLSVTIDSQSELLLMMGPVCYGITRQTKISYYLFQNNHGKFIIMELENHLHGNYELLVKSNWELLIACLSQKCQVHAKTQQKTKELEKVKQIKQIKKEQKKQQQIEIGLPASDKDNNYVKASKYLGQGLYFTGKLISKGITAVGGIIANNVQKSDQIKFSDQTKQNLRQINHWSGQAFQYTSGQVKNLINYGKQVALNAVNQNQGVKKIEQQKVFNSLKEGVTTGVKVFINLYDGFVEAGDEIKNGAFKGGQQVLKKKYGLQAQEALRHVATGVNNAVKIYKLPKNSVKYLFRVQKDKPNNQLNA